MARKRLAVESHAGNLCASSICALRTFPVALLPVKKLFKFTCRNHNGNLLLNVLL